MLSFTLSFSNRGTFTCHLEMVGSMSLGPLTPNDPYSGRTAPLTSKRRFLYIYSTNIGTEYFKCGIYSPFFSLQNAICFIILTYLVPVLFTFYVQNVLKLKKSGAKRLKWFRLSIHPYARNNLTKAERILK